MGKYDYNAERQLKALEKYDWGEKSEKQVAKYMSNKLDKLGYKVPKYLKQGKITQSQLDKHLDRIYNKLSKQAEREKEDRLKKSSKAEYNRYMRDKRIDKNLEKYNTKLAKLNNEIDKLPYPSYIKEYLKGEEQYNEVRDKSFFYDNSKRFIDRNNLRSNNLATMEDFTRKLNNSFNVKDTLASIQDTSKYNQWFNENIINGDLGSELTVLDKTKLFDLFNKLYAPEMDFIIKMELDTIREKYKTLKDMYGGEFDEELASRRMYNRITQAIFYYLDKREE